MKCSGKQGALSSAACSIDNTSSRGSRCTDAWVPCGDWDLIGFRWPEGHDCHCTGPIGERLAGGFYILAPATTVALDVTFRGHRFCTCQLSVPVTNTGINSSYGDDGPQLWSSLSMTGPPERQLTTAVGMWQRQGCLPHGREDRRRRSPESWVAGLVS